MKTKPLKIGSVTIGGMEPAFILGPCVIESEKFVWRMAQRLAEICAAGRPAFLVPFPHAAGDHQTANAEALRRAGAAEWTPERDLSGQRLAGVIRAALADPDSLARRAAAARALARPHAAAAVVDLAEQVAAGRLCRRTDA